MKRKRMLRKIIILCLHAQKEANKYHKENDKILSLIFPAKRILEV